MAIHQKLNFRQFHLVQILKNFENQNIPLDRFLRNYFHAHKSVGSHDRKEICEKLYFFIRWKLLIEYMTPKPLRLEKEIELLYQNFSPLDLQNDAMIPTYIRLSFPKLYFEKLCENFSLSKVEEICKISNEKAPVTIRANTLKTTRDALYSRLSQHYSVRKTPLSPFGIQFDQSLNFFALKEFQEGLFEIQDEGSQIVASLIQAKPKEQVLDYCAGSGGKTLAFAPFLQGSGQIFLYDIRKNVMFNARKRLKRAGIENAQWITKRENLSLLLNKMDWVLVDVPCSGSGTLRRNPDSKWRFDFSTFQDLLQKQRQIFQEALQFLKLGKKIVYATCSLFKEENSDQVDYFLKNFPLTLIEKHTWLPKSSGQDGFFAAIFEKNS